MPSPSSTHLPFLTLDVFTSTRYTGNPLAIIHVPGTATLSQSQKQRIAREFNYSETVFLHERTQADVADRSVRIDIFTTHAEIPFAGHPTVGTANYLLRLRQDDASLNGVQALQAKAGRFEIALEPDGSGVQISVAHDVHLHGPVFAPREDPVFSIVKGMTFILAQLADVEELASRATNLLDADSMYTACEKLDEGWREGLVGTYCFVDQGTGPDGVRNLRTRMFASREDPATGSAACALTAYLSLQEGRAGRYRYKIVQGVEMGQRSEILVEIGVKKGEVHGFEIEEVLLSGSAVQVMQGTLEVPGADD
jgi:PhzF family phenazine biosynthesis protein